MNAGAEAMWRLAKQCEEADVALVGASQDIDLGSAGGELNASIMLSAARVEARRTSERIAATNKHRREMGIRPLAGQPVWGLRRVGNALEPHPERAPILLDAIDRIINGKLSIRGLAEELVTGGVKTLRGRTEWSHRGVTIILRSPSLAGMIPSKGDVLRGDDGLPIISPGTPLLTIDRWQELQAAMAARSVRRTNVRKPAALLHLIVRDEAGHPMYRWSQKGQVRYLCNKPGCKVRTSVDLLAVENYVTDEFLSTVDNVPETVREVLVAGRDVERLSSIRAEIAKTMTALNSKRDPKAIGELAARLAAQHTAEGDAEGGNARGDIYIYKETGWTIAEAYRDTDADGEKREILSRYIESVVIHPHREGGRPKTIAERLDIMWVTNETP